MSHTTRRKSAIKNLPSLKKAIAKQPGAKYLGKGKGRGAVSGAEGHQVQLPGWNYPVTVDLNSGECTFDNYGGRWGKEELLDKLKQDYGVEEVRAKAEAEGHEMEEITLSDGSVKCVIPLGGGGYETADGGGAGDDYDV